MATSARVEIESALTRSVIIRTVMLFFTIDSMLLVDAMRRKSIVPFVLTGMRRSISLKVSSILRTSECRSELLLCSATHVYSFSNGTGEIYPSPVSGPFPTWVWGVRTSLSVVVPWCEGLLASMLCPELPAAFEQVPFFCCYLPRPLWICFVFCL